MTHYYKYEHNENTILDEIRCEAFHNLPEDVRKLFHLNSGAGEHTINDLGCRGEGRINRHIDDLRVVKWCYGDFMWGNVTCDSCQLAIYERFMRPALTRDLSTETILSDRYSFSYTTTQLHFAVIPSKRYCFSYCQFIKNHSNTENHKAIKGFTV